MGFQLFSAGVLALFYGCYFAKMLSQKRWGIRTDQLGRGKTGLPKYVEVTMKSAAVLVLAVELVCIFTGRSLSPLPLRIAGAAASAAGTLVFIAAVLTMGDSWRAGVPGTEKTELVTGGVYRFSRNPAFLGFDLLHIGILLMFFNGVLCIATCFAVLMYHLQIVNVEEDFLLAAFGQEYADYRRTVCRYIGRKRQPSREPRP